MINGWDRIFGSKEERDRIDARIYASPEYADWVREEWEREHPVRKRRNRRLTLRTVLAMARRAGQAVCGATIKPDGSVELAFGQPASGDDHANPVNPWDEVFSNVKN